MTTAERGEHWTGPQLAAWLAAADPAVPEPAAFLVCRLSRRPDGSETELYYGADDPAPFAARDLPHWCARHGLQGGDLLSLSLLVIRETLDDVGLIRDCTLECRLGAPDGPLHGNPARVTFTGPARSARFFRAARDGGITEVAGPTDPLQARGQRPQAFEGEQQALRAMFGEGVQIVETREPMLYEAMAGLDRVVHVRAGGGREIGCGIGWHGPVPFVLTAAFPRLDLPPALSADDEAAVRVVLARKGLIRHETRADGAGPAVIARRRGTRELLLVRVRDGAAVAEPYVPAPARDASADQAGWMRFAETLEHLAILDAWRDSDRSDLLVISGTSSGQIWRHHIDPDGVETWRRPDDLAAAGMLYRDELSPGTLSAVDAVAVAIGTPAPVPTAPAVPDAPPDSLLAKAEAYAAARLSLRRAEDVAVGDDPPAACVPHLRELLSALETLGAETAAETVQRLLRSAEAGEGQRAWLVAGLARLAAGLPEELAATRLMTVMPGRWRYLADSAPFGETVADWLPRVAHNIEEAAICLAFHCPGAVVFHCMRIVEAGLDVLGIANAGELTGQARQWAQIMPILHAALRPDETVVASALAQVRRLWRGPGLVPADKYTEAEAERLFRSVGDFVREVAGVLARRSGG